MIDKIPNLLVHINEHLEVISKMKVFSDEIDLIADLMIQKIKLGGKIMWCGNGGSAADSQHYAAELMVRYTRNRKPIASVALTTDTSLITAHTNDYDYETLFSRQVEALSSNDDVLVGISTSGNSINVLRAIEKANELGILSIALLGNDGGKIAEVAQYSIIVPSVVTARIQETHLLLGHYLCDKVEHDVYMS
jgi:D-sedoheptulose 7-phosphate isomerase